MHYVRVIARRLYQAITYIIPLSDDEHLARTVTEHHVSIEQIRKGQASVIILMHIDELPVRALIHTLKYHGSVESAAHAALLLAAPIATICVREKIDYIVPIPLSEQRLRTRGFNQVTYMCEHMTHHEPILGSLLHPTLLKRNRHTLPQTKLSKGERAQNVAHAFTCTIALTHKRILLIDDVVTTGATLIAAQHALKAAGASSVTLCAFAGR